MGTTLRKCSCGTTASTTEELDLFELSPRNKYGRANRCKKCSKVKTRKYRKEDPSKAYIQAKKNKVKHAYGITLEEYNKCMDTSNVCENCGKDYDLQYDHDHLTGKFRGVLCGSCNRSLGVLIGDSVEKVEFLLEYMKRGK